MGWANCGCDDLGRPIGYAWPATCDELGCAEAIDRGLSYVCGGMHGGDDIGCGGYFCYDHLFYVDRPNRQPDEPMCVQVCNGCAVRLEVETLDDV